MVWVEKVEYHDFISKHHECFHCRVEVRVQIKHKTFQVRVVGIRLRENFRKGGDGVKEFIIPKSIG